MLRFLPLSGALLLAPALGHAQTAAATTSAKAALTDKLAAATCDCLQQKQPAPGQPGLSKEAAKNIVIQCSAASVGQNLKAVQAVYGAASFGDKQLMNQLGREMGAQMLQTCPTFITYSLAMVGQGETSSASPAATTGQTTGQLGALHGTDAALLDLVVGKTEKAEFAWGHHFPQDAELLGQLEQLKGRAVRVSWQEMEVLQPGTRQYRKQREITALELL